MKQEEPVFDYDVEGLIKLREKLDVPTCATETPLMSMYSIPEYLIRRAVDIVRSDVMIYGGITPCKKIAYMFCLGINSVQHVLIF